MEGRTDPDYGMRRHQLQCHGGRKPGLYISRRRGGFPAQYEHVVRSILGSDLIYGFCYTQLSDVEQETNGLLTYDRIPKCDPAKIRAVNSLYRHNISID